MKTDLKSISWALIGLVVLGVLLFWRAGNSVVAVADPLRHRGRAVEPRVCGVEQTTSGSGLTRGLLSPMTPRRRRNPTMKGPPTRVADLLNPAFLLIPAANVIMQLSLPGVGHGVVESPVDSGNVFKHPFKRLRTSASLVAASIIGTEADRAIICAAVDGVHRQVRSTPSSSVPYNAFDPRLQLWVAACGYRLFVDQHEFLYGPLDDASADAVYEDGKRLGTMLQMRGDKWPPDRLAFDAYWKRSLDELRIDPPVRKHLHGVATLGPLPWPMRALAGPLNLFATTGFLTPEFRTMMQLNWSQSQQHRFEWLLSALRLADRIIPHQVWIFFHRLYLWDMRFRARHGWRIV
jgi:uncharacterized protein (DUF2236 family)